jgi:hypothetical protein
MPPEPTEPTPAAGTQVPPTGTGNSQIPTSREILEQEGVETKGVNWKAKYDGLVGASRQRITELQGQLEAKDLEMTGLKDQITKLTGERDALKSKADEADTLKTQLTAKDTDLATAKSTADKQALLLKYPTLLALKGEDGTNPMVDVLMSANMPIDQLEARLAQLAKATFVPKSTGSTPPPPPAINGTEDAETIRTKALEVDRDRAYHGDTPEKKAESERLWELFRKAQRANQTN